MAISSHWIKHIEDWQSSGLSQAAYCRQHHLNSNSFSGRLSEFRKIEKVTATPELISVQVQPAEANSSLSPPILIHTKQGNRLELPTTISAQWLAELLQCLN